jgi:ribosomal protein L29
MQFEIVDSFGDWRHNNVSEEITNRLTAANRSYFRLRGQFKSQLLDRKTKILIHKTLVWPILTYAAETRTTTNNDERRLFSKGKCFA